MKTVIVVSDCLRYALIEEYFPNDFILHNHYTLYGFTGIGTGEYLEETSILDIAPTICLLNKKPIPERFEGKAVPIGNFI